MAKSKTTATKPVTGELVSTNQGPKGPAVPTMNADKESILSLTEYAKQDAEQSVSILNEAFAKLTKTRAAIWAHVIRHHAFTPKDWSTYVTAFRSALLNKFRADNVEFYAKDDKGEFVFPESDRLKVESEYMGSSVVSVLTSNMERVGKALYIPKPNEQAKRPLFVVKGKDGKVHEARAAVLYVLEGEGTLQQKLQQLPRDARGRKAGERVGPQNPTKPEVVTPPQASDGEKVAEGAPVQTQTPESLAYAAKQQGFFSLVKGIEALEDSFLPGLLAAVDRRLKKTNNPDYLALAALIVDVINKDKDAAPVVETTAQKKGKGKKAA